MPAASVLLDTHVLLWILSGSKKLKTLSWLKNFPHWMVSPISLLEMKFLKEAGRLEVDFEPVISRLKQDERFRIDSIPLEDICEAAFGLVWTRDPFDRLLVAHSMAASFPLGTCDTLIQKNYSHVVF